MIRDILGSIDYDLEAADNDYSSESSSKIVAAARHSRKGPFSSKLSTDKEKEVLKHRSKTFLMPIVNRIGEKLFEGSLEVAASLIKRDNDFQHTKGQSLRHTEHHTNPSYVTWGKQSKDSFNSYESVTMDGEIYHVRAYDFVIVIVCNFSYICIQVGDIVMVEPEESEITQSQIFQASQTVNRYGNRWWYVQN